MLLTVCSSGLSVVPGFSPSRPHPGPLPSASDLGNLAQFLNLTHTRFTYHRTWETGLGVEIRVATVSPDFFAFIPDSP